MDPIQFYLEFASPYSYLASLDIDEVARTAGREAQWLPVEIDAIWKAQGVFEAYSEVRRVKRRYIGRDATRCAKMRGVRLATPSAPARDTSLAKLAYWGLREQDPELAKAFLRAVWHRYFGEGKPIGTLEDLAEATPGLGRGASMIEAAASWTGARPAQDACNAQALASGCFGIPWFVADGDAFFGQDRLSHLAAHLGRPR